jgi:hypothetical protein
MKINLVATAFAAAVAIAAPTFAFANSRHHHQHSTAMRGYGVPMTYRDLNRPYPPWGYDPDPELEASLRKDLNSGMIDFPGIGR